MFINKFNITNFEKYTKYIFKLGFLHFSKDF